MSLIFELFHTMTRALDIAKEKPDQILYLSPKAFKELDDAILGLESIGVTSAIPTEGMYNAKRLMIDGYYFTIIEKPEPANNLPK